MRHLTKLFDSSSKLKFADPKSKLKTVKGIWSKDGEFINLVRNTLLDGRVEQWLNSLLTVTKDTMRHVLSEVKKKTFFISSH